MPERNKPLPLRKGSVPPWKLANQSPRKANVSKIRCSNGHNGSSLYKLSKVCLLLIGIRNEEHAMMLTEVSCLFFFFTIAATCIL